MGPFSPLGGAKGLKVPMMNDTREQSAIGALIEEWLQLFLKIVDNASMQEQLKNTLEDVLQGNTGTREPLNTTPQYVQWVKKNKQRMGKEF